MSYSHVLLDLDGTVYVGGRLLPGVAEALARLRAGGVRLGFVTNDPMSAREDYARRLVDGGLEARPDEILTAAWAVAQLIAEERLGSRVLAVGSPAFQEEHRLAGLEPVEDPAAADVVCIGGDFSLGYAHLRDAVRAVLRGAALYGASRDRTFPQPDGPAPAAGAAVAAVEYATGVTARCAGKPEVGMFHEAHRLFGPGRYLMVGDRLDSDISGGAAAGLDTALVLTGSTAPADLAAWSGAAPTHVLGSAAELPALCLDAVPAASRP